MLELFPTRQTDTPQTKPLRTLQQPLAFPTTAAPANPTFWQIDEQAVLSPPDGAYVLALDTVFQARHAVTLGGASGPVHEHTYRVQVRCGRRELSPVDHVIVRIDTVRQIVHQVVLAYDSRLLNELPPFVRLQPTTEVFAGVLYQQLRRALAHAGVTLVELTLWESPTIAVTRSMAAYDQRAV
jgi:6-pyruvoyltetrahydropterin/6-carboxytetrahydropterin synthase